MKKLLSIAMLLLFSVVAHAQNDVTRFLGIPVDGSKSEMIRKLKEKGYRSNPYDKDILEGEFNGIDVKIHVFTNNDKVSRIVVCDANTVGERDIQIRFNKLCEQFASNPRYMSPHAYHDYLIDDEEDISYEITVHKKRYEAVFYQQPAVIDSAAYAEKLKSVLLSKYTTEQIADLTEEDVIKFATEYVKEQYSKRPVWFMISDYYGKYSITMFYDNEYNRANGEDL